MSYANIAYGSLVYGDPFSSAVKEKPITWENRCPAINEWQSINNSSDWLPANINNSDWDNKTNIIINSTKCKE